MITTAFVNIWNQRVGAIAWDSDTRLGSFQFEPGFQNNAWYLAPIRMPVISDTTIYSFPDLRDNHTFKGLPGLVADVLPDKYGNALINAWLTSQGRPSDSLNPVETLCFIGKRGMGALEFEPVEPKSANRSTKLDIHNLVNVASSILSGRQTFRTNLSAGSEHALLDILKIGTSAGGARAKAVIAYNPETNEVRSGQADAPEGFTQWLIKFDGVHDSQLGISEGYGRVEMAYHLMAVDCGIEMTECRMLDENGRSHFMTRRFDRPGGKEKLHVLSFCALQHYDFNQISLYSYEQLFETMRLLRLPFPQAEQLFRRMVFNVLSRNCDDHTKNFAFIYDRTGEWRLSPAYDVCHAYRPGSDWVSQQSLSVNGKRQNITHEDLLAVAKQISLKKGKEIINLIQCIVGEWTDYAERTGTPFKLIEAIQKDLIQSS